MCVGVSIVLASSHSRPLSTAGSHGEDGGSSG